MTRTGTPQQTSAALSSVYLGHDAHDGFCPVCGTVAPCYRARRIAAARTSAA
jgi:hypothetical protein